MQLHTAELLAVSLISKHLAGGNWQFKWNDSINALGMCSYRDKRIILSKRWTRALPESEVTDTILHEIAHAMAGHASGHGCYWKEAC